MKKLNWFTSKTESFSLLMCWTEHPIANYCLYIKLWQWRTQAVTRSWKSLLKIFYLKKKWNSKKKIPVLDIKPMQELLSVYTYVEVKAEMRTSMKMSWFASSLLKAACWKWNACMECASMVKLSLPGSGGSTARRYSVQNCQRCLKSLLLFQLAFRMEIITELSFCGGLLHLGMSNWENLICTQGVLVLSPVW